MSGARERMRPPGLPLPEPTGQLAVERVSYAFPGQGVAMIKGVNFALKPGESLAVIGPSAAGKTTLIRLLIGTLPASAGHVRLSNYPLEWLAVPLSSLLFGAVHIYEGPVAVGMITILGLVMAGLFIWRRSLLPCIVMPFLNNFTKLLLLEMDW